jgi:hypothetical protein
MVNANKGNSRFTPISSGDAKNIGKMKDIFEGKLRRTKEMNKLMRNYVLVFGH